MSGLLAVYCTKYARMQVFSDPCFPSIIYDSVLIRQNTRQRKPVFLHILHTGTSTL